MFITERFVVNRFVQSIPLPEANSILKDGQIAMASGWGTTRNNSITLSEYLRFVHVSLSFIGNEFCNDAGNRSLHNYLIKREMTCAVGK